jgi:hypothetical protein
MRRKTSRYGRPTCCVVLAEQGVSDYGLLELKVTPGIVMYAVNDVF